jgi:ribonuclease HI
VGDTPRIDEHPEEGEVHIFQPPDGIKSLGQGLRALTQHYNEPQERQRPTGNRRTTTNGTHHITVYVGGVVLAPPRQPPRAAASTVYGLNDRRNACFHIPSTWKQTSLVAELAGTLEAVKAADQEAELTIVNPNDFISKAMTEKLAKWESGGWVGVPHSLLLKCLAAELKARRTRTTFVVAPQASEAKNTLQGS